MSKQYKVWRADYPVEDSCSIYNVPKDVPDAASAAKRFTAARDSSAGFEEWSEGRDVLVRDSQTGRVMKFHVEREAVPEYWCGSGVEVKPGDHDNELCECGHPFGEVGPCTTCDCVQPTEADLAGARAFLHEQEHGIVGSEKKP